jgi:hydrogenase maturation factor HypE
LNKCNIHKFFFDWSCDLCKAEYIDLKGIEKINLENDDKANIRKEHNKKIKNYREFNEERAKKLYEEIFLQYLKKGNISEEESINRSKTIIRKQCEMRGIEPWSWV